MTTTVDTASADSERLDESVSFFRQYEWLHDTAVKDMTNWTIESQMYYEDGSDSLGPFSIGSGFTVTDAANGLFEMRLSESDTSGLVFDVFDQREVRHRIVLTNNTGSTDADTGLQNGESFVFLSERITAYSEHSGE